MEIGNRSLLMKRILLTGSTGFIGGALQQRILSDGEKNLTVTVRRAVKHPSIVRSIQVNDLTAETNWSEALQGVDIVIHTAARAHVLVESVADPLLEFRKINVEGALALAQQAHTAGVKRFIFISSIGVNGASTKLKPFTESDTPSPHAPYAVSKLEAEIALQELCEGSSMELVIIRPTLVYAAHAPGNFSRLLKLVSFNLPLPFILVKNKRSFIALENLVDFILCCVDHPSAANEIFLIADKKSLSTVSLIRALAEGMDKRPFLFPMPSRVLYLFSRVTGRVNIFNQLCRSLEVDTKKAHQILNWTPLIEIDDGLRNVGRNYMKMKAGKV